MDEKLLKIAAEFIEELKEAPPDDYLQIKLMLLSVVRHKAVDSFLEGRGFKHVGTWQFNTAKNLIDRIAGNGWKIPNDVVPQEYKGA